MTMRILAAIALAASLGGCISGPAAYSSLGGLTSSGSAGAAIGSSVQHLVISQSGQRMPVNLLEGEMERMRVGATRAQEVAFSGREEPGTIIIETATPALFLVQEGGKALRFPVAVGRREHQWYGEKAVETVHLRPAWTAPEVIARANPNAAGVVIPAGSPNNPMGLGALVLSGGEYAIHGTNRPESIGRPVSFGCFRMFNEDIAELIRRTPVGARVIVR